MSDYRKVSDALSEGVEPEMLCMTCPWDRFCITPPSMTREDVNKQIEEAKAKDNAQIEKAKAEGKEGGLPMGMLITTLAIGGRDTSCSVCPVLALRLRSSEGGVLVQSIREQMQAVSA